MSERSAEKDAACRCGHRKAQYHTGEGWCCAPLSLTTVCDCHLFEPARVIPPDPAPSEPGSPRPADDAGRA